MIGIKGRRMPLETAGGNAVCPCGLPERPWERIPLEHVKTKEKQGRKLCNVMRLVMKDVEITLLESGK